MLNTCLHVTGAPGGLTHYTSVLGLHESDQVDDPVGVTHLIVVPGNHNKSNREHWINSI